MEIVDVRHRRPPMGYNLFSSPQEFVFRDQNKYHKNIPAKLIPIPDYLYVHKTFCDPNIDRLHNDHICAYKCDNL